MSLKTAQVLSLVGATATTGLAAGVFGLYAHTIMRGLGKTDDRTFVGAFLPASVGGDAVRAYSVSRLNVHGGDAVASVLLDRMIGVASILLMAMAGLSMPLESYPLQALVSEPVKPVFPCVVMSNTVHAYISQSDKGELVIGAGTAGLVTAAGAAGLGAKVALVERHLMGGDCLNVGCVPSKALIRAARAYAQVRDAATFGVQVPPGARVDFPAVMERMRRLRASISPNDSATRYRDLGVDVFFGQARFTGPDAIAVGERLHDVGDDVRRIGSIRFRLRRVERFDGQQPHPLLDQAAGAAGRHRQREEIALAGRVAHQQPDDLLGHGRRRLPALLVAVRQGSLGQRRHVEKAHLAAANVPCRRRCCAPTPRTCPASRPRRRCRGSSPGSWPRPR